MIVPPCHKACLALSLLSLLSVVPARPAAAVVVTEVIAVTGDPIPEGEGMFSRLGLPAVNNLGQVAFDARFNDTSEGRSYVGGLFRGGHAGLIEMVRSGELPLEDNAIISFFRRPALNDSGQVAFHAGIDLGPGFPILFGIYSVDGTGSLNLIVRVSKPTLEGIRLSDFGSFPTSELPALNNAGQTAFWALSGNVPGIYRSDQPNSVVQLAGAGDLAPDGNGSFANFSDPALNQAGQVAFFATVRDTTGGSTDNNGLYLGDGTADILQIVRKGQTAPDGNGSFEMFANHALNDAGQTVFWSELADTLGGVEAREGIFLADGEGSLVPIARGGDPPPDANGSFIGLEWPALNNSGQVAFLGDLSGTSDGEGDNRGIFLGSGPGDFTQIARKGEQVPGGNGTFFDFGSTVSGSRGVALNNVGQTAFLGELSGTSGGSSDNQALYLHDEVHGLTEVARLGDAYLGSNISSLGFATGHGHHGDERSGLNDIGQIAYSFELADGRSGIAIAQVLPDVPGDYNADGMVDAADFAL